MVFPKTVGIQDAQQSAMYPGAFGDPAEDCNCRCTSNTRARWALDEDELQTLKDRAKYFELDKTKDFDDFKKKYLKAVDKLEKVNYSGKVTAKRIESVEKAVAQMPVSHRLLAESKISGIEFTNSKIGNSYSKKTRIIKASIYTSDEDIVHEYAHALEEALDIYNDTEFLKISRKGLESITINDIIYDDETFEKPIYRILNDKFVSIYQGRLYEEYGIFDGSNISIDGMRDYFAEGYTAYIFNPNALRVHDPDLYGYFERIK